jgi:hypothetical protein
MPAPVGAHRFLQDQLTLKQRPKDIVEDNASGAALAESQVTSTEGRSQQWRAEKEMQNIVNGPQQHQAAQLPALVPGTPVTNEGFLGRYMVENAYTEMERATIADLQRQLPVLATRPTR